eukprot:CAMPEP_0197522260 /NCGR_PEP_ID=MMETSP1318-20131121/7446_1 /TAXON_ID=552666 /ORGANISM="Partenskyella glossopodia, Strain RCC365" /LENGTH=196 /DNA_ID=CAMNT_0043074585 /DNA_START=292 /DNA_END=882 /DNA_ORIENTATION=+
MGNRTDFIVETVTTKGKATVNRRYSEFKSLWQTLSRVGGLDNLPELPAASIFKMYPSVVKKRRDAFESALKTLIYREDVKHNEDFHYFLGVGAKAEAEAEIRRKKMKRNINRSAISGGGKSPVYGTKPKEKTLRKKTGPKAGIMREGSSTFIRASGPSISGSKGSMLGGDYHQSVETMPLPGSLQRIDTGLDDCNL